MVTAPASHEVLIAKSVFLTMYLVQKQFVNLFCYVSAFLDFSDQIVRQGNASVCVQGSYRPSECCRLQMTFIDECRSLYGVACYGYMIKQNLKLRRNLLTEFKSVMSYD